MSSHTKRSPGLLLTLAGLFALVASATVAACVNQVETTEQADEPQRQEQAEPAAETEDGHLHGHHHRGPMHVVFETILEHGDLAPEQEQAVRAIRAELKVQRGSKRELRERLRVSVADVVRAGSSESEQFEQAIDEATGAVEERMRAGSEALEQLHAILDADQRAAVAAALQERIDERHGERHHARHHEGFKKVATYLALSTVQLDKLKLLHDQLKRKHKRLRPSREELTALVEAFKGDDFGEVLDEFQAEKAAIMHERFSRAGEHTDTLLSLLSLKQRALLADLIERGPGAVGLEFGDKQ